MLMRTRAKLGLVLLILAVGGGLLGWFFLLRSPLAGDKRHDFGRVDVPAAGLVLAHTFELRNATGQRLAIKRLVPMCGCVTAAPSRLELAPDEMVDIATEFRVSGAGSKHVNIAVELDDGRQVTLTLRVDRRRVAAGK